MLVGGIPRSIYLGVSIWPARCHCSKGKATPKAVRGLCFGRVERLVLAASRQKGWARTMGRVLEQLSARQVLLTRSMCVGGLGAQGTHAKSTKLHATSVHAEGSANHLLAVTWNRPFSPTGRF